jgi:hypothetical protein
MRLPPTISTALPLLLLLFTLLSTLTPVASRPTLPPNANANANTNSSEECGWRFRWECVSAYWLRCEEGAKNWNSTCHMSRRRHYDMLHRCIHIEAHSAEPYNHSTCTDARLVGMRLAFGDTGMSVVWMRFLGRPSRVVVLEVGLG